MKFNTKVIHGGQDNIDPAYNAVMPPIYQTSTFKQASPGDHKGFDYARSGNPTRKVLENSLASIENGSDAIVFSSGVAAIDAVLKLLKSGDEVISTSDLYGGSYRIFTRVFENFGIKFHFVDMTDPSVIKKYINDSTKLLWIETPTNPMMNIIDIKAVAAIAKEEGLLLAVDNTFASPYLQLPLILGADIVMHSATKYLSGHSDVILGAIIVKDTQLANQLYFIQKATGAIPGPHDCFLTLRGIKTLHIRMQRHCENGKQVAHFLKNHQIVDQVYWPGFETHPSHDIAVDQMKGFGGMVSFTTKSGTKESAFTILEKVKLFTLAESLGGVESLIGHPATMTHASIPKSDREKTGVVDSLIRLSVGIEDIDDLIKDLEQAFKLDINSSFYK